MRLCSPRPVCRGQPGAQGWTIEHREEPGEEEEDVQVLRSSYYFRRSGTHRRKLPRSHGDCAAISGKPRLEALHESQSKNWPGQVTSANALVEAIIPAIKISDKCGRCVTLIVWDFKVVREATTGVNRRNLGVAVPSNGVPRDGVPSAADASDPGACESADMVRDLYLRLYHTMRHTYRMRGTGGGTGLCESRRWPRSPQHRHRRCRSR